MLFKFLLAVSSLAVVLGNSFKWVTTDPEYAKKSSCKVNDIAEANKQFALDLFQQMTAAEGPYSNIFISPMVISLGLSMVLQGANGISKNELESVMRYNDTLKGYDKLYCIYEKFETSGNLVIRTASRMYGERTAKFLEPFLKESAYYGAKMKQVDFINNAPSVTNDINKWVSEQTEGTIPELYQQGAIDSMTKLILTSAIYLKGFWVQPFTTTYNYRFKVFESSGGSKYIENVPFMEERMQVKFFLDDQTSHHFIDLPYKADKGRAKASMILVYTFDKTLHYLQTEQLLTYPTLSRVMPQLETEPLRDARVILPRFQIKNEFDMETYLRAMGLNSIFTAGAADLSRINGAKDLYISSAKHKTFIKVDQNGTEAAGVFESSLTPLSLPIQFIFDQPFYFLLWEHSTKSILFMGRIVNPRSTE